MTPISCWAIRHKPTGKFMPCRMYRTSAAGFSYWNPYEERPGYKAFDENPRLFFSAVGARNALNKWVAGEWKTSFSAGSCFDPPELEGVVPHKPDRERRREDMEIVLMRLTEVRR